MGLKGKSAVVTAPQGFGLGIAETFEREGAEVAVLVYNGEAAKAAAAQTCVVHEVDGGRCI